MSQNTAKLGVTTIRKSVTRDCLIRPKSNLTLSALRCRCFGAANSRWDKIFRMARENGCFVNLHAAENRPSETIPRRWKQTGRSLPARRVRSPPPVLDLLKEQLLPLPGQLEGMPYLLIHPVLAAA